MLYKNEKIKSLGTKAIKRNKETPEQINEKYRKGETRIVTEQARYPLEKISELFTSGSYELNPVFQRRKVWQPSRKSRLIESFIMNVPIPPIFLYEDEFGHYQLMDGLQRITTIIDFYKDRFALSELKEWRELNGEKYSTLPSEIKKGIDRRYLSSIILLKETAKSKAEEQRLKQMVFERINSGGVKLEPQEIRNAIHGGPLNDLCVELTCYDDFKFLMGTLIEIEEDENDESPYSRMEDAEFVLRYFASRQRSDLFNGGALNDYLDQFLAHGNRWSKETISSLREHFKELMTFVRSFLGENAFLVKKMRNNGRYSWNKKPSAIVFDALLVAIDKYKPGWRKLKKNSSIIKQEIETLYQENSDLFHGRNTNHADWKDRVSAYENIFEKYA